MTKTSYGYKYQIDPAFAGKTYADFTKVAAQDDIDTFRELMLK